MLRRKETDLTGGRGFSKERGNHDMKIQIDLEMTPEELRETLGLPDVKPVQDRWMQKLEDSLEKEIANLSPEVIVQRWTSSLAPNADLVSAMMQMMPGMTTKK